MIALTDSRPTNATETHFPTGRRLAVLSCTAREQTALGTGLLFMTPQERFWKKVHKTDGCWLWTASRFTNGYGQFTVSSPKKSPAHRYSWVLENGPIPEGLYVLHRCDNPICVKPAHLFLGTQQDNMDDMVKKGRQSTLSSPGAMNPHSKLSWEQVQSIRREYIPKIITMKMLGRKYGVALGTINCILHERNWKPQNLPSTTAKSGSESQQSPHV